MKILEDLLNLLEMRIYVSKWKINSVNGIREISKNYDEYVIHIKDGHILEEISLCYV